MLGGVIRGGVRLDNGLRRRRRGYGGRRSDYNGLRWGNGFGLNLSLGGFFFL
jgi:hypothetical protein